MALYLKFIAIRGVSDHGDSNKNDECRVVALQNAAEFLIGFIRSGLLPKVSHDPQLSTRYVAIHHVSQFSRPSVKQSVQSHLTRLQSFELMELSIDQTNLFSNNSLTDPSEALAQQARTIMRIQEVIKDSPDCKLGYFGLAHIPLMFHLGCQIGWREVELFEIEPRQRTWVDLPAKGNCLPISIDGLPEQTINQAGDVIVLMSISYPIHSQEHFDISAQPLAVIHVAAEPPTQGLIDSKETLDSFTDAFRNVIHTIYRTIPRAERIHLFYAGPPTLAFRCGQQINKNIGPEIVVYNYSTADKPNYGWAINLRTDEVIERRNV